MVKNKTYKIILNQFHAYLIYLYQIKNIFSSVMAENFYKNPSKKEIEEAFRYFDTDNSGKF